MTEDGKTRNTRFSGRLWYKAFGITWFGGIDAIDELFDVRSDGPSVSITWEDGKATRADLFENAIKVKYRLLAVDDRGRVAENSTYEPDGQDGWRYVDTWRYEYGEDTGRRVRKIVEKDGHVIGELRYDEDGDIIKRVGFEE